MTTEIKSPSIKIKQTQFAHSAATTAHQPIVINSRAFLPINTADANVLNTFVYEAELVGDKATGALAVGAAVYWDASAKKFTATSTSNTLVGYALEAAASADTVTGLIAFNSFTNAAAAA